MVLRSPIRISTSSEASSKKSADEVRRLPRSAVAPRRHWHVLFGMGAVRIRNATADAFGVLAEGTASSDNFRVRSLDLEPSKASNCWFDRVLRKRHQGP